MATATALLAPLLQGEIGRISVTWSFDEHDIDDCDTLRLTLDEARAWLKYQETCAYANKLVPKYPYAEIVVRSKDRATHETRKLIKLKLLRSFSQWLNTDCIDTETGILQDIDIIDEGLYIKSNTKDSRFKFTMYY